MPMLSLCRNRSGEAGPAYRSGRRDNGGQCARDRSGRGLAADDLYLARAGGVAPCGYTKGMAAALAEAYRMLKVDDCALLEAAKPRSNDAVLDQPRN